MGTQMSVETGAKSAIPLRCAPNSQPFRNCSSDKSGSFAEAEAYHSFYRKLAQRHFNPRAPEGCNTPVYFSLCSMRCFNPRAPRGARPPRRSRRSCPTRVSTHAPREGRDAASRREVLGLQDVSTHAPREGRDESYRTTIGPTLGFNPRAPRGARPARPCGRPRGCWFQPTRPARGATRDVLGARHESEVSTHAPREGRDGYSKREVRGSKISTHAPLWGATAKSQTSSRRCLFQPTRPYGARRPKRPAAMTNWEFQPTRPYGARLAVYAG